MNTRIIPVNRGETVNPLNWYSSWYVIKVPYHENGTKSNWKIFTASSNDRYTCLTIFSNLFQSSFYLKTCLICNFSMLQRSLNSTSYLWPFRIKQRNFELGINNRVLVNDNFRLQRSSRGAATHLRTISSAVQRVAALAQPSFSVVHGGSTSFYNKIGVCVLNVSRWGNFSL